MSKFRGFTLVELLVVISIIAILSVIGMTIFSGVQKNARDSRRRADVDAISQSLEAHFNNTNCGATATAPYCKVDGTTASVLFAGGTVPSNPTPGGAAYSGLPAAAQATYTIKALLENGNGNCQTTIANDSYCKSNQQ